MTPSQDRPPDEGPTLSRVEGAPAGTSLAALLALLRQDQRLRWRRGERPRVEDYLDRYPVLRADAEAVLDLVYAEFVLREELGEIVSEAEYLERFPGHGAALQRQFDLHHTLGQGASSLPSEAATVAPAAGSAPASEACTVAPSAPAASEAGTLAAPPVPEGLVPETRPPGPGDLPALEAAPRKRVAVAGYEVMGTLGEGGMGVVYKARQTALGRVVALKMILHAEHAGADARERFQREAEAVARLQHPNIVQVFEVGEHEGLPFFSLEFCPGGSLADQLDGTPWEAMRAARLVETLARAMHAAHQAQVIHRDLKPANVLLTADGQPKITDFGLAKKLDEQGKTQTGAIMGTPSYMAPEQAGGKSGEIGPAADVYALGAILYDLLTGRPPFKAATPLDTVLQVISDEPVPPRQLQSKCPADLETITLKCLQKEPGKRYVSAEALAEDLRRFVAGEPIVARPVGRLERAWKWARRRPAVAGLLVAVLAVLAAGLGGILWSYGQAVNERNAARAAERATEQEADKVRQQKQIADEKADEARRQAKRAEDQLDRTELALYGGQLAQAQFEWQGGNAERAVQILEGTQWKLRAIEFRYLWTLCNSKQIPKGLTVNVGCVAFRPDSKHFVSGEDSTLKVRDTESGQEIRALKGHTRPVACVAYSPDGKRIVSGSGGHFDGDHPGELKVWNADTGREIFALDGHSGGVSCVAYSPDGRRIVSGSADATLRVWDASKGKEILVLRGHKRAGVTCVAYSPDGRRIIQGYNEGTGNVKVWDADKGQAILTLEGDPGDVTCVGFSPDSRRMVSASLDSTLRVWDIDKGHLLLRLNGHTGPVFCAAFSPDGQRILSGGSDGTLKIWDADKGQEVLSLKGHTGMVFCLALSPDGKYIVSGNGGPGIQGTELKIWDAHKDHDVQDLKVAFAQNCVRFSPDGKRLATALGNTLKIVDTEKGQEILALRGHTREVTCAAFSPDGRRVVSGSKDQTLKVWDADSGQEVVALEGHRDPVLCVAYSHDGKRIVSGSYDQTLKVWDADSGREIHTLEGDMGTITCVAFSPDGQHILSGSEDSAHPGRPGDLKVWDAEQGKEILALKGHVALIDRVAYSPDGKRIVSSEGDRLKVWDANEGCEIATLAAPGGVNQIDRGVAFWGSPDGQRFLIVRRDLFGKPPLLEVWDTANGEVRVLAESTVDGVPVAFSPDGQRIIYHNPHARNTLKLWHLRERALTAWH